MSIHIEVISFIRKPDPVRFEPLALRVFRYQFDHVRPYRAYCEDLGIKRDDVRSLEAVPAVSTLAFKHTLLTDRAEVGARDVLVFLTSGTTVGPGLRGRHVVPNSQVYRASALTHLASMLFPDGLTMRMLSLHPAAEIMPESSLARMITWCIERFGRPPNLCAAGRRGLDCDAARRFLVEAAIDSAPVCLLGTTASFGALFDFLRACAAPIRLPRGSRLMDTGGRKGQAKPLEAAAVTDLAARWLGIDPSLVINEYGMTEMCSQLYDATPFNSDCGRPPGERSKIAPAWIRAWALDPVSLRPAPEGEPGTLAFFDLANVGSVSAVMTEDLGTVIQNRVRVLGRAGPGEARGCALAIEQFAAVEAGRPGASSSGGLPLGWRKPPPA